MADLTNNLTNEKKDSKVNNNVPRGTSEADEQIINFYDKNIIECLKQLEGVKRKLLSLVKK